MDKGSVFERIEHSCAALDIDFSSVEMATYANENTFSQEQLAEKINVSRQSISKWESAQSVPDMKRILQLAELFGITVNELICDPNELPQNSDSKLEKAMTQVSEKALKRKANKNVIQALSSTLVWFIALSAFVILSSFDFLEAYSCLLFFVAIPANAIVLLSLRSAWRDFRWNRALISVIVWGSLASVYATLFVCFGLNIWKIFLLGIPGQIAIFLWFRMYRPVKEKKEELPNE